MHYTGTTYRPPYEAQSLLLQVTTGCSHNACTFCSMYRDVDFEISPLEEVEADLIEAAQRVPYTQRIFLENGDAFCLPFDYLEKVAKKAHRCFPNLNSIGGYASIKNIATKSDEELENLAKLGYANFNIGLESGLDDVLSYMNKGYTLAEARTQFERLHKAGMPFNLNIINAAAGPARIEEHAAANAAIVNFAQPTLVFVSPLHADPGTPLEQDIAQGRFTECTLRQYIEEEMLFLEALQLEKCIFYGLHVSNPIPVHGTLPQDKEALLQELREGMAEIPDFVLDGHPEKGHEGRIWV